MIVLKKPVHEMNNEELLSAKLAASTTCSEILIHERAGTRMDKSKKKAAFAVFKELADELTRRALNGDFTRKEDAKAVVIAAGGSTAADAETVIATEEVTEVIEEVTDAAAEVVAEEVELEEVEEVKEEQKAPGEKKKTPAKVVRNK